jgi:NADH-quinone oxidoreductase subunit J
MSDLVFVLLSVMTVVSALIVAGNSNVVYSAVGLLFTFMGVAGLYVLASADFLAATQMLVYVGGILVLILFAVFLSNRISDVKLSNPTHFRIPAFLVCVSLFGLLSHTAVTTPWAVKQGAEFAPTTANLGRLLMTKYLLPFEIVSVLLLAALIGAALLSRPDSPDQGGKPDMEEGN